MTDKNGELNRRCSIVASACDLLLRGRTDEAIELISAEYPLDATPAGMSIYSGPRLDEPSVDQALRHPRKSASQQPLALLHARDGYVDRYTGTRVIAPSTLKLLGHEQFGPLRSVLPYHVNGGRGQPAARGMRTVCHQAGFELYASYEHVRPIAAGGEDELHNLVTSAFDTNKEKGTQTWAAAVPPASLDDWDGLSSWLIEYTRRFDCSWFSGLTRTRRAIESARLEEFSSIPAPQWP